jgi:hypothetical protein
MERGSCQAAAPTKSKFKNTEFVHLMICNVSRDLPSSCNQSLELADDLYIRILKNKIKELKTS